MGKFTKEQEEILNNFYWDMPMEELCQKLGIYDKKVIYFAASYRKLKRKKEYSFSQEEKEYIIKNCRIFDVHYIAKVLGRTPGAITQWAKNNHVEIFFKNKLKPWDEEEFIKLYPYYTNKYLSEKFFPYLTSQQLVKQARRFNLVKSKEKSAKWYDKVSILEKLEEVCVRIGRVPLLAELQENGLPSEKTFSRYFGSFDQACKEIGRERPRFMAGKFTHGEFMDNRGNKCFSYSEKIISDVLIEMNLTFEKETLYSTVMPVEEVHTKRFDWSINNEYFIEYFGLFGYKEYDKKVQEKKMLCEKYKIKLLCLYEEDIRNIEELKTKILLFLKT